MGINGFSSGHYLGFGLGQPLTRQSVAQAKEDDKKPEEVKLPPTPSEEGPSDLNGDGQIEAMERLIHENMTEMRKWEFLS